MPPATTQNAAPKLVHEVGRQEGIGHHVFSYDLAEHGIFADPDGDPLTYEALEPISIVGSRVIVPLPPSGGVYVIVNARDPSGERASVSFDVYVLPNSPPVVTKPNLAVMTQPGMQLNYDATQGGGTFSDPEGDRITYSLALASAPNGLAVDGLHVTGALSAVGMVSLELTATDEFGAVGKDRFAVAIAGPEPGRPTLPSQAFVYADNEVPLPQKFRSGFSDSQPDDNRVSNAGAALGRVLFYDKRLSLTNTHACGSCHHQTTGFASPERFNTGVLGVPMKRNSMALGNTRYNIPHGWFWDIRASSLEELALMPIQEPTELGNFLPTLEQRLAATDFYPPLFEAAFGTADVTRDRIAKALAQFLRSLVTYRSRFDEAYTRDPFDQSRLTAQELRGRTVFRDSSGAKCAFCHSSDVQTMVEPTSNGLDVMPQDLGVGGVFVGGGIGWFRAPSLRNIAVTAPYMHDGRFATLRDVIEHYDHGIQDDPGLSLKLRTSGFPSPPIRLNLSPEDKDALEAFLNALTDDAFVTDPKFADPFQ